MIRLNPDVIVYNEARLVQFMRQPSVHGVFSNCLYTYCDEYAVKPCLDRKDIMVMTDFLAFRPERAHPYDGWLRTNAKTAERWATAAFKSMIDRGNLALIQRYNNSTHCRISQEDISHSHEIWTDKLDYIIDGRTSCPLHDDSPCTGPKKLRSPRND